MRTVAIGVSIATSLVASILVSLAQTPDASVPDTSVQMRSQPAGADNSAPVIIGGKPANPATWPATFIFETNEGFCTSTAIASQLIITAAHCVNDGAQGDIVVAGSTISLTCRHHPLYRTNYTADVALCVASSSVPVSTYERINTRTDRVAKNDDLTLLGYGCRQTRGGGPNRALFEGIAAVNDVPGTDPFNHYTTTLGGAAVCFGDSGGAAYKFDGVLRYIAGINSRGDIISRSLLTTVALPDILNFIKDEGSKLNLKVCGIDPDAPKCRS